MTEIQKEMLDAGWCHQGDNWWFEDTDSMSFRDALDLHRIVQ